MKGSSHVFQAVKLRAQSVPRSCPTGAQNFGTGFYGWQNRLLLSVPVARSGVVSDVLKEVADLAMKKFAQTVDRFEV